MNTLRFAAFAATAAVSALAIVSPTPSLAGSRVTNGVVAQDRPTTGALLSSSGNNHQIVCSGTLIGCQTFLTAAHCVCDDSPFASCGTPVPSQYSVFLQDVGIVSVSAIDVDPSYSFANQGDVAVLTLSAPITGVSPTPINTLMRPPLGTTGEIAGFGLTQGGADDTGMLRRGLSLTSTCTAANDATHVCWAFTSPIGAPGIDSNSCNGDSGGPLFADLGVGDSVIGITSGGTSNSCLPLDASYDADVYVHRAYIQSIGGGDLLNTTCGGGAQVGAVGADRTTFSFDTFNKDQQKCRKEFTKAYTAYVTAALKATQSCLDGVADGSRTPVCPDAKATTAITKAESKVSLKKLSSKCPESIAPSIQATGLCAGALDAMDLQNCILAAGAAAVSSAISSEYADDSPAGEMADEDARKCQKAVGKATGGLLKTALRATTKCQSDLAANRTDSCPDAKTTGKLTKADSKTTSSIAKACTDADVATLDGLSAFGGTCAGATTVAALQACELADHATISDDLLALLTDQTMETDVSFTVPPGAAVLRVTLNGRNTNSNDLDLYIRAGAPATTSTYDARSENGGMFEETEILAPAAGTWYAHIERFGGDTIIPYQLSATAFQP